MKKIVLIAHNLRSIYNVGSLLRTAEGLGVSKVYLTGYTPYPLIENDPRLPHLSRKINDQIHKTALGAEEMLDIEINSEVDPLISRLKGDGYLVLALEQAESSIKLNEFNPSEEKIALLVGREVEGVEPEVLKICDHIIEIPMLGEKESFNVVQAAAMALYVLCYN